MFEGKSLVPYPTAINWNLVDSIEVVGPKIEIRTSQWGGIEFHLATPAAAEEYRKLLDELRAAGIVSVAQRGRRVTIREGINTHHGPIFSRKRDAHQKSAAEAVRLAGTIDALRGRPIHSVTRRGNAV